jgi:anti-sigma factor RsiW
MRQRITCEEVEVGIAAYLDDALPPTLHQRFTAHLHACPECSDHLQRIRWTIDHLRTLPRTRMPPGMKMRLLDAFRSHAPFQPDPQPIRPAPDFWLQACSLVAASETYPSSMHVRAVATGEPFLLSVRALGGRLPEETHRLRVEKHTTTPSTKEHGDPGLFCPAAAGIPQMD